MKLKRAVAILKRPVRNFSINVEFDFGKIVIEVDFLVDRIRRPLRYRDVPRLKEIKVSTSLRANVSSKRIKISKATRIFG